VNRSFRFSSVPFRIEYRREIASFLHQREREREESTFARFEGGLDILSAARKTDNETLAFRHFSRSHTQKHLIVGHRRKVASIPENDRAGGRFKDLRLPLPIATPSAGRASFREITQKAQHKQTGERPNKRMQEAKLSESKEIDSNEQLFAYLLQHCPKLFGFLWNKKDQDIKLNTDWNALFERKEYINPKLSQCDGKWLFEFQGEQWKGIQTHEIVNALFGNTVVDHRDFDWFMSYSPESYNCILEVDDVSSAFFFFSFSFG
jgi:hypothetical protein